MEEINPNIALKPSPAKAGEPRMSGTARQGGSLLTLAAMAVSGALLLLTSTALASLTYLTLLTPVEYLPVDTFTQRLLAAIVAATILMVALAAGVFWAAVLTPADRSDFARAPRAPVMASSILTSVLASGFIGWGLVGLATFRSEAIERIGEDPTVGLILDPGLVLALESCGFVAVAVLTTIFRLALNRIAPWEASEGGLLSWVRTWLHQTRSKTEKAVTLEHPEGVCGGDPGPAPSVGPILPMPAVPGGLAQAPLPVQGGVAVLPTTGVQGRRPWLTFLAAVLSVSSLTLATSVALTPLLGAVFGLGFAIWWFLHGVPGPEYGSWLRALALRRPDLALGVIGTMAIAAGLAVLSASGPGAAAFAFLGAGAALGFRALGGALTQSIGERDGEHSRGRNRSGFRTLAWLLPLALAPAIAGLVAVAGLGENENKEGAFQRQVIAGRQPRGNGASRSRDRSLKMMSMPELGPGNVPARPLAIALFLRDATPMDREVRRFSRWLAQTQRPETVIRLLRRENGTMKATQATSASALRTDSRRARSSVAFVESWLGQKRFRHFTRMAIAFGPEIPTGLDQRVVRARIRPASGASPTSLRSADPDVLGSFAAAAALNVTKASGEVLARNPETSERTINSSPKGDHHVPGK